MNANDLSFGIEIESIAPDSAVRDDGLRIGAYKHGIQVPYLPAGWKAERDGSINNGHGGHQCEIVSPVLQGEEGLRQVAEVMRILEQKGHRVNASCGVHYAEQTIMRSWRGIQRRNGRLKAGHCT
jgi:Putative amidoligase enzyme